MIHHLIHGTPTPILHVEGLAEGVQRDHLVSFRQELALRPQEAWKRPWGAGGSLDPAFVGWPRVVIERDSRWVEGYGLDRGIGLEVHHCFLLDDDRRYLMFVKPRARGS